MKKTVFLDYSQEELDLYYDQRRWLPAAEEAVRGYATKSAAARAQRAPETHRYGPALNEALDWFAASRPLAPTMVFVHGGAWVNFTKDDFSFVAGALNALGLNVCVLNFTKLRCAPMAEMIAQVRRGIAWAGQHAADLGAAPGILHLCGHSSGAHLASMALVSDWPDGPCPVTSAVMISGVYDLEPVMLSARRTNVRLEPAEVRAFSPLLHTDRIPCPVLVACCELDTPEFRRQALAYAAALKKYGKLSRCLDLAGANHFNSLDLLADRGSVLARAVTTQVAGR